MLSLLSSVFVFDAPGRGGGPAEPRRRPALRPGSASGPAAQPLSLLRQAGRQVGGAAAAVFPTGPTRLLSL